MRGEGREGKWAQGRAPSPKKGRCAIWFGVYILSIRLVVSLLAARFNCVNILGLGLGLSLDSPNHPTKFCMNKKS